MYRLLFLCVLAVSIVSAAKLPKGVKLCKYDDTKCQLDAYNDAVPLLSSGHAKAHLVSIDPLEINKITMEQGDGRSPVSINITLLNCKLHGYKNLHVSSIKGATKTPKGFKLEMRGFLKAVRLEGEYEMNGKVLVIPLSGKGKFSMDLDNVTVDSILTGEDEPVIKNGEEYLKLKKYEFKLDLEKMRVNFDGLYNGDKALGDSTNAFLNENWRTIFNEMKPNNDAVFSKIFYEVSNNVFDKIPYKNLFLPE